MLIKSFLYIISVLFVITGITFKLQNWDGGNSILALGLLGILVYSIAKVIKELIRNRNASFKIFLLALIALMSVIIFAKYLWYRFSDYPGLIVVPLFIFTSIYYLIKGENREPKLITTSVLYLILSIPLFISVSFRPPRKYLPSEWYNRYTIDKSVSINLPYGFKYIETEQLSIKAHELKVSNRFYEAINLYEEALRSEPRNPRVLFDFADAYAKTNNLEQAVILLDTAIMIDSLNPAFYNNRGLLYFHLNDNSKAIMDYLKAIEIDTTETAYYYNIALAYYYDGDFLKACESINKAEQLGLKLSKFQRLRTIKRRHCK